MKLDEALTINNKALEIDPAYFPSYVFRAYIYAATGHEAEAHDAVSEIRRLTPNLRISQISKFLLINDKGISELFVEGMRKAGLPE